MTFWSIFVGKYCSLFSQCYILKKKTDPIWNEGHPFPRDVDYMVADTLESLRPKLTMYSSLEQAVESLQKLNKEHQEQIGWAPYLSLYPFHCLVNQICMLRYPLSLCRLFTGLVVAFLVYSVSKLESY